MAYNPFPRPLGERLDESDLHALIGKVAEGYYVEYKENLPTNKKIAHSIASLANTYGGWYLVGISTDANHVADAIPGFDQAAHSDPVATVRDVVKTRIDPMPFVQIQTIPLSSGRLVLAVHVPPRQRPPYVTYDGRVYRRSHDSSDPVPEDRRHALDQLVEEGRRHGQRFARFRAIEEEPSRLMDENRAWLNLYLMPDPEGVYATDVHTTQGVERILNLCKEPRSFLPGHPDMKFSLPFSHVYRSVDSARLRQARPGDLTSTRLVAELSQNGNARFHLPVKLFALSTAVSSPMSSTAAYDALRAPLVRDTTGSGDSLHLKVFAAADVMLHVMLLVTIYEAWLGHSEWNPDFLFGFSFRGAWSTCPFVDTDGWADQVRAWGLPVIPRDIVVPDEKGEAMVVSKEAASDSMAVNIVHEIAAAMGLQQELVGAGLIEAVARQAASSSADGS